MQHYLDTLRARGELLDIEREIDPKYQLAAVTRALQTQSRASVRFLDVRGSHMPVISNLYSQHHRLRDIIACPPGIPFCAQLCQHIHTARSMQPWHVPASETEEWLSGTLSDLPIATYHERDGAPYITSGIFVANNPATGVPNLSFHRSMFINDQELRIRLGSSHDLARFQRDAEAQDQALEAAILISTAPQLFMAACVSLPPDGNELALAAAMQGAPLPMRRCHTINLMVPAQADIVIEGRILPHVRRPEGPFGEFMGYYVEVGDNHVFEVTHVGWRRGAAFHALICGSDEDLRPLEAATATRIYQAVSSQVPGVLDVSCQPTVMNTVIQIRQQYEGHARHALLAAMGAHLDYNKLVVVVDEDVNPYDMNEVMWAFLTRGRADTRSMVLHDVPGFYRDPHKDHWGRLGLDATKPWGREAEFVRKRILGEDEVVLREWLP